jgi:hypothetical protein
MDKQLLKAYIRTIVEEEQQGELRAKYGKQVLKELSVKLKERFGKGFSEQNLRNMRQFFLVYQDRADSIRQKPSSESQITSTQLVEKQQNPSGKLVAFQLGWSHYLILMRIENPAERRFYEIEAAQTNWSEPQLKRQYHASLYERLALSRNKEEVKKLAQQGILEIKHYEF